MKHEEIEGPSGRFVPSKLSIDTTFPLVLPGSQRLSCSVSREVWGDKGPPHINKNNWVIGVTVDGRNPVPVDVDNILFFIGFDTSQVVQDLFHQQYHPTYSGYNSTYNW